MESAGLLLFRTNALGGVHVLLGHMGGPFWVRKPRSWSIPKGHREVDDEDLLAVAEREFAEEMGSPAPSGASFELGSVRSGKKTVVIFARAGAFDASCIISNTFPMEWPPGSGRIETVPEMDRAEWMDLPTAAERIVASQAPFLARLAEIIARQVEG
jgi:predicted NUDIX family NTP pyrophosphohydrolase